jgi:signal transduction histidine kinase
MEADYLPLREKVHNLSAEQQQVIAIAKVLTRTPRLIMIDQPNFLSRYPYQQILLSMIQEWQRNGVTILFASNNLDHLFAVTDRIVVLRSGEKVAEFKTDETSREEIVSRLFNTQEQGQLTPAIWALDSYYRAQEQAEKLRYHQTLLEKNLAETDSLNQELFGKLSEQVNALDDANKALQEAQRRLLKERELERKHLARELHDQVIQDLLSENYRIEEIGEQDDIPDHLKEELIALRTRLREMVVEIRQICGDLRPPTIDALGLGAAIQSFTHDWEKRTGIEVRLSMSNLGRLPEAIELSIFRIVQEGLNNIRKHAESSWVEIQLEPSSPRDMMITISDNGVGLPENFDLAALASKGHYGLLGVSERVALLGGRLRMNNIKDGGTVLQVEIPHPKITKDVKR